MSWPLSHAWSCVVKQIVASDPGCLWLGCLCALCLKVLLPGMCGYLSISTSCLQPPA